ncbi:MAG TPA: protein kinase, partial [Gemmatimonadaceae bacterium]|nr:protein kinase [Gemmatimonadaceae bacterium]
RAAAALDHPNICAVHQVIVEADGRACIVMQYVEGETLAARLRAGPLEPRLAVSIVCDLADALSAAHKRGIIHRDLKPQNVIVTADRRAKLLDFGIARNTELSATTAGDGTQTSLTTPGIFVGTPPYMSPEQFQQQALDGRSDLFSLGALFFECLTGRRAFEGRSQIEIFTQVLNHHPPPVSALRPELTDRYDEVCRRLLAKHPDDRFRSAEELLGALRVLSPDTARSAPAPLPEASSAGGGRRLDRRIVMGIAASAIVVAALGVWTWKGLGRVAGPSAGAEEWYRKGTEKIRDGAYYSGRLALLEAVAKSPVYAAAYVRLAEANTELDDVERAQQALLKVGGAEAVLPAEDRLRFRAVRALMLRDVDEAVRSYGSLANKRGQDPGAWLDLGRAQDASALAADARVSYDRAIQLDDQYAAAYLRRASILALEGGHDAALKDFGEAARLYGLDANLEGQAETFLRRGGYLSGSGNIQDARPDLERARTLAAQLGNRAQEIRAELQLSSIMAWEGRSNEAQALAGKAIAAARENDLETVAADGLIDLSNMLLEAKRYDEAAGHLDRALELARTRNAPRIVARAEVQRAALLLATRRPDEAVRRAEQVIPSTRQNRYRRYELIALNVISRGRGDLGQFEEARASSKDVLRIATEIKDDLLVGGALENLAGLAVAAGSLPEAHGYRARSEKLHRERKEIALLGYDLTNRSELLIRLGRPAEADPLLREVEAGIASGIDSFKARERRAKSLRAVSAATEGRFQEAARVGRELMQSGGAAPDTYSRLAGRLIEYSDASMGRPVKPAPIPDSEKLSSPTTREIRYWALIAYMASGDAKRTLAAVTTTLADGNSAVSYEFEWRVAAIGAAAARRVKDAPTEQQMARRARQALDRLRSAWKADASSYDARPDLVTLRRNAGLNIRS